MAVAQRQLFIDEEDVFYLNNSICDLGKDPEGSQLDKYIAGFQVADKTDTGLEWARIKCVDVRYWKADPMGRPSWWPNPYLYYKEKPDYEGM